MGNIASIRQAAARKAIKEYLESQSLAYVNGEILDLIVNDKGDHNVRDGWYSLSEDELRAMLMKAYATGGSHAMANVKASGIF